MKLKVDMLEAKHWIYPLNQPKRDYQFNIVRHCLFDNTLVALPTGLGKTFIAGVVMLNCESLTALLVKQNLISSSLSLVSEGKGCVCCPNKTSRRTTNRRVPPHVRHSWL